MTDKVIFPVFEMFGPPCETPGCSGVLTPTMHLKTKIYCDKCFVCGAEHNKMPAAEKLAYSVRVIKRAVAGEGEN